MTIDEHRDNYENWFASFADEGADRDRLLKVLKESRCIDEYGEHGYMPNGQYDYELSIGFNAWIAGYEAAEGSAS